MSGLVGRLTKDAELKQSGNGTYIANFCIALSRAKKVGEEWEEQPHFFYLNIFGKRAESLTPYLLKGQTVSIEGHLEQDRWESNGVQHSKMALVIDDIQLIGSVKKRAQTAEDAEANPASPDADENINVSDDETDPDFDMNIPEFGIEE